MGKECETTAIVQSERQISHTRENGDESYKNDESEKSYKSDTGKLSLFSPFVAAAAAAVTASDGKYTGNTRQFCATSRVLWRESATKRTE